jgi:putative OPT family oligopeptide transporter
MEPVLNLLAQAYAIGTPTDAHPNPLLAPQAVLMASVARGIFGGALPWDMIAAGAAIGALIILVDSILKARGAHFRVPVLACAVGIYLPLDLSAPIFLGGVLAWLVERKFQVGRDEAARDRVHRMGMLFAAGLITGEALMGIIIAIPIVVTENPEVLALPAAARLSAFGAETLGLALLAVIAWLLYRTAVKARPAA